MSVKSELRKLVTALGGTPSKNTIPGLLGEVSTAVGGESTGKTVAEQVLNIAIAKGYFPPIPGAVIWFTESERETEDGITEVGLTTTDDADVDDLVANYNSYTVYANGIELPVKKFDEDGTYITLVFSDVDMEVSDSYIEMVINKSIDDKSASSFFNMAYFNKNAPGYVRISVKKDVEESGSVTPSESRFISVGASTGGDDPLPWHWQESKMVYDGTYTSVFENESYTIPATTDSHSFYIAVNPEDRYGNGYTNIRYEGERTFTFSELLEILGNSANNSGELGRIVFVEEAQQET